MRIELREICKRFGRVPANDRASLTLGAGEVLALLGENGAGKSTLMKVLYGFYRADSGGILVDGRAVSIQSPRDAIAIGIGMVFQQFSLIPALSVRENLLLADPATPWLLARRSGATGHLAQLAPDIDPRATVRSLSVGQMQLLELAKVLNLDARVVILDEPTSVLTPAEAERLWATIRSLAAEGRSVVMITHKLEDVAACADRVAVMRAGRVVAEVAAQDANADSLTRLMMGDERPVEPRVHPLSPEAPARVRLAGLSARTEAGAIEDIELQLRAGEVLGVAGVSGNGQQILADAVAGLLPLERGEVIVDGAVLQAIGRPVPARPEIGYIPEQPLLNAVAPDLDLGINLALKSIRGMPFFPARDKAAETAAALLRRFDVRPPQPALAASALSGGNLQKLVAARELSGGPALVVACYPTMGLDVAASAMVYEQLFAHAACGACVLWISEDIDDLLRYSHRVAVLFRGRILGQHETARVSRQQLGMLMAGERSNIEPAHA